MQMTKESEYALLGLAYLASLPESAAAAVSEVAAAQSLPAQYLAKIFNKLARHGLLNSERGRGKGYALARPADSITVEEVIVAVEGPDMLTRCLLWQGHCHEPDPCPLHYRLKEIVPSLISILHETTIADYVANSPHAEARGGRPSRNPSRRNT